MISMKTNDISTWPRAFKAIHSTTKYLLYFWHKKVFET